VRRKIIIIIIIIFHENASRSHDEVLAPLLSDVARRFVPPTFALVHFDAHADLSLPPELSPAQCLDRSALLTRVGIADWILPLVHLGVLERVVWLRGAWAGQMPDGEHLVAVGVRRDSGLLGVSSPLDYYTDEGEGGCSRDELDNVRELKLCVMTVPEKGEERAGTSSHR
jgi:hypothetical protein